MKLNPACAALALLAVCGCGGGGSATGFKRTVDTPNPSAAVVRVEADYMNGRHVLSTGFVYDIDKGLLLAPDHGVEGAHEVHLTMSDGTPLHGLVLARAQCHDFAVIRLHPIPAGLTGLRFVNSDAVRPGDRVSALSYAVGSASANGVQITRTTGTVAAVDAKAVLHPLLPAFSPLIAHQTPLNSRGSGSPLLNRRSQVIGINMLVGEKHGRGALAGLQYALASNEIRKHLAELKPASNTAYSGWEHEHACHRQMNAIAGVKGGMGTGESMPGMHMAH
ncbi:MAG TPA: S1C family serine protease [Thermoleophilaceae bacterium]|jgi:S1-C subfamily serine protease|nr:S1C family serine protease [Thermoleophilaceae bacterium]